MSKLKSFRILGVLAAVFLVVVAVRALIPQATASANPQPLALPDVSGRALQLSGWFVTVPSPGDVAGKSRDVAIASALRRYPGATVRYAELGNVQNAHVVPVFDHLCWIVSIAPQGGINSNAPAGGKPLQGSYFLVFVDAMSGEPLMATSGGEPAS